MIGLQIPEIYWDDENAVSLLVEYFTRRRSSGDLFYSGAHFERLGGGGDAEHVADRFDSYDLLAITMLNVSLEPHGAINLLTDPDGLWARLLSLIPRDARLENCGSDVLMEEGGPVWELWERLAGTKHYPGNPTVAARLWQANCWPASGRTSSPSTTSASSNYSSDRRWTTRSGRRCLRPCGWTTVPSMIS